MPFHNFLIYDSYYQLKYCKFNFNFDRFQKMFSLSVDLSKDELFEQFLELNNFDYLKPYTMKPIFEQLFDPITNQMIEYLNLYGVPHGNWLTYQLLDISSDDLMLNQFEIIYYPHDKYNRIQDYNYVDNDGFMNYNKYNFDYVKYSSDMSIYGSKLLIFTDFIVRCLKNPDLVDGYGILDEFKIYFKPMTSDILAHIENYGLFSNLLASKYNDLNIDLEQFIIDNSDLNLKNKSEAYDYIISNGQFELLPIKFIQPKPTLFDITKSGVCTIYSNTYYHQLESNEPNILPSYGGFLYMYSDNNYYLITTYNILADSPDIIYVYALFENSKINQYIAFKIIGYDKMSNILVAIYDPDNYFNIIRSSTLEYQTPIKIKLDDKIDQTELIYSITNIDEGDNLALLTGSVIKTNYGGSFSHYNLTDNELVPESMIVHIYTYSTMIGSPILIKTDPEKMMVIGIIVRKFDDYNLNDLSNLALAINGYLLDNIIQSIILKWGYVGELFPNNDILLIEDYIKDGFPKAWLGIQGKYYNPNLKFEYDPFSNFAYIGGLVITNIICGYNTQTNQYVFSSTELINKNIIRLFSPLENSLLYKRFIESGSIPIVIKTIKFYDCLTNQFQTIDFGKYGSQKPYSRYVYGQQYVSSTSISNYTNPVKYYFQPIIIYYYYFNGIKWIFENCQIGSANDDFYIEYSINNYKYLQNKFEFPLILFPYLKSYYINI